MAELNFGVTDKLVTTCTDNARSFDKAFRIFGRKTILIEDDSDSDSSESSDDEDDGSNDFQVIKLPELPNQIRCASHTLSLIAKCDSRSISDRTYSKLYDTAFEKLHALWNKVSRSTKAVEIVFGI